jgi:Domain of unknown function (DUF6429)
MCPHGDRSRKIDNTVLVLRWLTLHDERRAWKDFDWDTLDRLHTKGFNANPAIKVPWRCRRNRGSSQIFSKTCLAVTAKGPRPQSRKNIEPRRGRSGVYSTFD